MALNRGEKEKVLNREKSQAPEDRIVIRYLEKKVIVAQNSAYTTPILREAIEDSYQRLIAPAIEREIQKRIDRKGRRWGNQSLWKELRAASDAAANRRDRLCLAGTRHFVPDVSLR